jgi:voltage-gated potassium channel Kch
MFFLLLNRRWKGRASKVPSFDRFIRRLEILCLVVIAMGIVYGVAEHASWSDSMWLVWQTITTVGYGDIPPKTLIGRFGVMITGLIAIALLSYVLSAALDYREDQKERRRLGLETNEGKNSYLLICCRNEEELITIIEELRCVEPEAPICVVDDIMKELPPKVAQLSGVSFVRGSILLKETYERAGIASCRRVIIFPHQPDQDASDATTQTLVSLVERLAPKDARIMHFLVDPVNEELFEGLRSRAIYADFAIFAAIQECQDEGSVEIFSTLMSNTHGANPTTFYPDKVVGWTWGQFVETALQVSRAMNIPINPLALIQEGRSNPCPGADQLIEKGDTLSLIVHRGFSYPSFEAEMAKTAPKVSSPSAARA